MKIRNTFIIFIVSGFWHGANWTFIVWGTLNAIYFLPLLLTKNNRKNLDVVAQGRFIPNLKDFSSIVITFILTVFAWIFFRAENIAHALQYISGIISPSILSFPELVIDMKLLSLFCFISVFLLTEWLNREAQFALQFKDSTSIGTSLLRKIVYIFIIFSIFVFGGGEQEFIYFQF